MWGACPVKNVGNCSRVRVDLIYKLQWQVTARRDGPNFLEERMSDYRILFDLEATCWEDKKRQEELSEIIEIGAVKFCPKTFKISQKFRGIIKPQRDLVSEYCTKLTGIKQEDLEGAPAFPFVYEKFMEWSGKNPYFIGWGQYDYDALKKDCDYHTIKCFPERRYMNGKHLYQYFTGTRAGGLGKRIKSGEVYAPLEQHRALNDAIMTVQVLESAWKKF